MKQKSLFWPFTLIAAGVLWILVSMGIIEKESLWALVRIWPVILIAAGLNMILRGRWPIAGIIISALIVLAAFFSVIMAPQVGWNQYPSWEIGSNISGSQPGSGRIVSETRDVKDFVAISIRYPAQVVIRQDKSESVVIEADDNLLSQIQTDASNGVLYIENKETSWNKRVNPTRTVKITITVKDLHDLELSSAGNAVVENLQTDDLKLSVSGAGDVDLTRLNVRSMSCRLSGTGNIHADGVADVVDLRISGVGSFNGTDLQSQSGDIHISGAGNATMWLKRDLTAEISGAGSISYYGDPALTQHVSGVGSIKKLGTK
jgi:hypothetical protein